MISFLRNLVRKPQNQLAPVQGVDFEVLTSNMNVLAQLPALTGLPPVGAVVALIQPSTFVCERFGVKLGSKGTVIEVADSGSTYVGAMVRFENGSVVPCEPYELGLVSVPKGAAMPAISKPKFVVVEGLTEAPAMGAKVQTLTVISRSRAYTSMVAGAIGRVNSEVTIISDASCVLVEFPGGENVIMKLSELRLV